MHLARLKYWYVTVLVGVAFFLGFFFYFFLLPGPGFYPNTSLTVDPGVTVRHEAALLKESGLIRSTLLFRILYRLMPGIHGVQSGTYNFPRPVGELRLAWDLAYGKSEMPDVRITFPEGTTVRAMGAKLATVLPGVDEQVFDSLALPEEGYLFPDTYFLWANATSTQVIAAMKFNFTDHLAGLQETFDAFGKTEREVVTMASILEGEAQSEEDMRIVAGILWKRIAIGMPLQVDATFGYTYGRTGYVPTAADLKGNSAYNTYRYTGLPPTPINNPGEKALRAATTPTKSPFLYYLTGTDGKMHYAKTFAEHIQNQKQYFK